MKKIFALLLAVVMCLSMAACGSEKDVVTGYEVSTGDATPALNLNVVNKHITRVELTVDNWRDYIKEYSYDVEIVEKDAFGEITKTEQVTVYRLGYGTEKYYCLDAIIELKHKQTGEIATLGQMAANLAMDIGVIQYEPFHLDEYECTRIKGYMYFIDYSEEVMKEVLNMHDRSSIYDENASITVSNRGFDGVWFVDCEAKVIESGSDNWKDFFELRIEPEYQLNEFDEVERLHLSQSLVFKKEYDGRVTCNDVAIEMNRTVQVIEIKLHPTEQSYTLGEVVEKGELTDDIKTMGGNETLGYSMDVFSNNYITAADNANPESNSSKTVILVDSMDDIEAIRIKGTITIDK